MAYRISFVPKKTGEPIKTDVVMTNVRAIMGNIAGLQNDPSPPVSPDILFSHIKHAAAQIVEFSKLRTICAPDEELKALQRGILTTLERIPMHRAAHGFIRFRDPKSCATAHTAYWGKKSDQLVVLNMDAKNFFHSVTSPVVRKALEAHGITPTIATKVIDSCMVRATPELAWSVITGLADLSVRCGTPVDERFLKGVHTILMDEREEWANFRKKLAFVIVQSLLQTGPGVTSITKFLPQGAPTSPFLSNLAMKIVDIRLSAMAKAFGGFYTRYADDLTVTWETFTKGKVIDGMYRCTEEVLGEYHVNLNRKKKKIMGRGVQQNIVGYVINSGVPTISQKFRKRVRAALHNEMVRGSERFRQGRRPPAFHGEAYAGYEPTLERQQAIRGKISYVASVHPKEAANMVRQLEVAVNGPGREIGHAEHEFEVDFETTDRTIWGED